MARKRYEEESESQERWLVSYADFITLLFAFFVVMYAVSSVNDGKVKVASNALTTAFGRLPAWLTSSSSAKRRSRVSGFLADMTQYDAARR